MFEDVSSLIPDDLAALFTKQSLLSGLGTAGQALTSAKAQSVSKLDRAYSLQRDLGNGTQKMQDDRPGSPPTRSQAAQTENPADVEAAWMARLSKFAGIAQSTGVKLGG